MKSAFACYDNVRTRNFSRSCSHKYRCVHMFRSRETQPCVLVGVAFQHVKDFHQVLSLVRFFFGKYIHAYTPWSVMRLQNSPLSLHRWKIDRDIKKERKTTVCSRCFGVHSSTRFFCL